MANHKQVSVQYHSKLIEVDEGLAELLQLIWARGINTRNSCQENKKNTAWIQFSSAECFRVFLGDVVEFPEDDSDTLYRRVMGTADHFPSNWKYQIHPFNMGVEQSVIRNSSGEAEGILETYRGFNLFDMYVSIRFPTSDIPLLVEILKKKVNV